MIVTIVGYDKSIPNGSITLSIDELVEQDYISERMLNGKEYTKGSMRVKMNIDNRSFYEGILEHAVRRENG